MYERKEFFVVGYLLQQSSAMDNFTKITRMFTSIYHRTKCILTGISEKN